MQANRITAIIKAKQTARKILHEHEIVNEALLEQVFDNTSEKLPEKLIYDIVYILESIPSLLEKMKIMIQSGDGDGLQKLFSKLFDSSLLDEMRTKIEARDEELHKLLVDHFGLELLGEDRFRHPDDNPREQGAHLGGLAMVAGGVIGLTIGGPIAVVLGVGGGVVFAYNVTKK